MTEQQTSTEAPKATDQEEHLDTIVKNMSKANPDVIAQQTHEAAQPPVEPSPAAPESPKATGKPKKGATDRLGNKFDPALHEVNSNGSPRINRDGYLAGKPGRPGKFKQAHASRQEPPPADHAQIQPQVQPDQEAADRKATAAFFTLMFISGSVGLFGEEWLPTKGMNEQEMLINKCDDWLKSMGISDLPPGLALVAAVGAYAAPRVFKPNTQTRMKIVFVTLKDSVGKFIGNVFGTIAGFLKKIFKGVKQNAAHVNPRDNGDRKDNASAPAGTPIPA